MSDRDLRLLVLLFALLALTLTEFMVYVEVERRGRAEAVPLVVRERNYDAVIARRRHAGR